MLEKTDMHPQKSNALDDKNSIIFKTNFFLTIVI